MATSIASAVRWWGRTKPDAPALVVGDDTVTYGTLHHWSSRIGRSLADRGVGPGDFVCVLGGNTVEWAASAHGVLKAGAVLQPVSPRAVGAELKTLIDDVGSTTVIVDDAFRPVLDDAIRHGAKVDAISMSEISEMRAGDPDEFVVDIDPDDTAMVLWTSGSSGRSKGVIFTNRTALNIVFEAMLTEEGVYPGHSQLLVLPFAFTPGVMWGVFLCAVLGSKLVAQPQLEPSGAVKLLQEHECSAMFGVPQIFAALAAAPEFADASFPALKTTVTGGAPVPVPLLKTWAAKGVKLRQIYGMTEAGGVATGTIATDADDHPETCGTGGIFTEVVTKRSDGSFADIDEPGELVIRGPGVTPGYHNDPDTTAEAIRDGWLHSGDLGVLEGPDGRVKFLDRMKDLIITGGINISPLEIEAVIAEMDGVEEVAVVRAPDEKWGETPAAIIVGKVEPTDVIERCSEVLSDIKVPRYVVVRDEPLPRQPSQKVDKVAIRTEYAALAETHPRLR